MSDALTPQQLQVTQLTDDLWRVCAGSCEVMVIEASSPFTLYDGDPRDEGTLQVQVMRSDFGCKGCGLRFTHGLYVQGSLPEFWIAIP